MAFNKEPKRQEFTVFHLFSGIGGGALGFQESRFHHRGVQGSFVTLGGIDVDPDACKDFEMLIGVPATCLDLFSASQYRAFHGRRPPKAWREATPADIRAAAQGKNPDVVFMSAPCKGFSGLLPNKSAQSEKYQALNRLTLRGLGLCIDSFRDDLPAAILFENVPRITSRGMELLAEIKNILGHAGYVFHEGTHNCGELGGLGQNRKRYLLIARNPAKLSTFIYQPPKQRVKSIGEVIGPLPMPDDAECGAMHRLPRLQWKTWVRLALIPAGGDWRDLEKIAPEQYRLQWVPRGRGTYGVQSMDDPGAAVIGNSAVKGSNASAIADTRLPERENRHINVYRVAAPDDPAPCVTGTRFGSGALAFGDPRGEESGRHVSHYRVVPWDKAAGAVTGADYVANGAACIQDQRLNLDPKSFSGTPGLYGVNEWDKAGPAVTGSAKVSSSNCPAAIADHRINCSPRSGAMGVQSWDKPSVPIVGASDVHAGAAAIADHRFPADNERLDPPPLIISIDNTWHRPLTTLELAVLQGLDIRLKNGKPLVLAGNSDGKWRERIGNMVPRQTATAIAIEIGMALLMNGKQDLVLHFTPVWVQPNSIPRTLRMTY